MVTRAGEPKSPTSSWKRSTGPSASSRRSAGVLFELCAVAIAPPVVARAGPLDHALGGWYIYCLGAAWSTLAGGHVTKSFSCRDAGVVCRATVTGADEEEVLAKAVEHAREAHGVDLTQSTTLGNFARSLIRDDAGNAAR